MVNRFNGTYDLFRVLAADTNAVAAADAPLRDNLRLTLGDANSLRGTFAHTGVTDAAFFLDG